MPFLPPNQQRQSTEGIEQCTVKQVYMLDRRTVGSKLYAARTRQKYVRVPYGCHSMQYDASVCEGGGN